MKESRCKIINLLKNNNKVSVVWKELKDLLDVIDKHCSICCVNNNC